MDSLDEWIAALQATPKLILVEGKNDEAALRDHDITNVRVIVGIPFYRVVEEVARTTKEVIVLTDLDKEGRRWYGKLRHALQARGVKIDTQFREFLLRRTTLTHIEGLAHYLRRTL